MFHFLIPNHPLAANTPDDPFAAQFDCLHAAGFSVSLCDDGAIAGDRPLRGVPEGATVVYRGWMLDAEDYESLVRAIEAAGGVSLTSLDAYLAAHHLPNWYPLLQDLTPETIAFPADVDIAAELRRLGWDAYFLKDFVKSLKTAPGPIVRDPDEAPAIVAAMREFRGKIEGGICVRRLEPFLAGTERRYFAIHGQPSAADGGPVPAIVAEAARRIALPFVSVDVVRREDEAWRVVEVGDGQVSDLVGWTANAFAAIWADRRG